MTRILYWNIENFTINKIHVAAPPNEELQAGHRLVYIVERVLRGHFIGTPPDIFVVVEVGHRSSDTVGIEGSPLSPTCGGGRGVLFLLDYIRIILGNHWCVVPPLNLGAGGCREGVAVFYNSIKMQFIGPNLNYQIPGSVSYSQPVTAATLPSVVDYRPEWKNGMPYPTNPIPALQLNRVHNGVNEWQSAGEFQYYYTPPPIPIPTPYSLPWPLNRIWFPNYESRGPYQTKFLETAAPNRVINLFTVHTSPGTAVHALGQMSRIPQLNPTIGDNEVRVVLGDFNIDSYRPDASCYQWMINAGYTMALSPWVPSAGPDDDWPPWPTVPARKPYLQTHLLPTAQAFPFNATGYFPDAQHNVYPRYGYMGSAWPDISDSGAIDNIFTWYGATAGGPAANMTVVNTVVGKPYKAIGPPTGVTNELIGGVGYESSLCNQIPVGGVNPPIDTIAFQSWQNFGLVRSTSDHLPLMIDV